MNDPLPDNSPPASEELHNRRLFLKGVGKWSGAAIMAAIAGSWIGTAPPAQAATWINRRSGGGWINGGGGGGWVNRGGGGGGWINGGGGGGGWINRRGGGGGWINRR
ncbi:hypothetical protein HQ447_11365 [bacterium]|nr:hypothetical protein [bacterium]